MQERQSEPGGNSSDARPANTHLPMFVPFAVTDSLDRDPLLASLVKGLPKLWSHHHGQETTLAAVLRPLFKRSQQKNPDQECRIELASGMHYVVDPADHFAAGLAFGMLGEEHDLNTFLRLVEPSSIVLDIGANFGLYTVESARLLTTGRVFAFEPVPETFALLKRNITANGLDGVTEADLAAIATTPGERSFYVSSEGSFSGLTDTKRAPVAREIVVQCSAIDELPSFSGRTADLIKIDVEGAEAEVLRSARSLIARSPDVVIQFEAQTKNMDAESLASLVDSINDFHQMGFELRAGWNNASPGLPILAEATSASMMVGNLYLTRRGSKGERRLMEAIKKEMTYRAEQVQRAPSLDETVANLIEQLRLEIRRTGHLEFMLQQAKQKPNPENHS